MTENISASRFDLIDRGDQFLLHISNVAGDAAAEVVAQALAPIRRANGSFDAGLLAKYRKTKDGPLAFFVVPYLGTSEIALAAWAAVGGLKVRDRDIKARLSEDGPDGVVDWLLTQDHSERLDFARLAEDFVDLRGNAQFRDEYFGGILREAVLKWRR